MTITFEKTKAGYANLWKAMNIRSEKLEAVDKICDRIISHQKDYEAVEKAEGVPWYLVAGLHSRESDLNFNTYLGNGQPLNKVTTEVPAGRGPFSSWAVGASDALQYDGLNKVTSWPIERILFEAEKFNGQGYFHETTNSPYVWSWTNQYSHGKFTSDGHFDANVVDAQCGVAAIIKRLSEKGIISLDSSSTPPTSTSPIPAPTPPIPTPTRPPMTTPTVPPVVPALPQINIAAFEHVLEVMTPGLQFAAKFYPPAAPFVAALPAIEKAIDGVAAMQATGGVTQKGIVGLLRSVADAMDPPQPATGA